MSVSNKNSLIIGLERKKFGKLVKEKVEMKVYVNFFYIHPLILISKSCTSDRLDYKVKNKIKEKFLQYVENKSFYLS